MICVSFRQIKEEEKKKSSHFSGEFVITRYKSHSLIIHSFFNFFFLFYFYYYYVRGTIISSATALFPLFSFVDYVFNNNLRTLTAYEP